MEEFKPFNRLPSHTVNLRVRARSPRRWVLRARRWYKHLAVAMVIGGIGGEGVSEYLGSRAETDVREFDNKITVDAQHGAIAALGEAHDALEQSKRDIDARLQLEKQLIGQGPRANLFNQGPFRDAFVGAMKPFAGQKVAVRYDQRFGMDSEMTGFALAITSILGILAEWKADMMVGEHLVVRGVSVQTSEDASERTLNAARALRLALKRLPLRQSNVVLADTAPGIDPDIVVVLVGPHP